MRYWAIRLFASIQKVLAVVYVFVACGWFIFGLTVVDALIDQAAPRGVVFDGGPAVVVVLMAWALAGALITCLWLYAFAQLLELLTDIHSELRSMRLEMRQFGALARHDPL